MNGLWMIVVLLMLFAASECGKTKEAEKVLLKKRCKRDPRPCGGGGGGMGGGFGGGTGGGIERITVVGRRPPTFRINFPIWMITSGQGRHNQGRGGGGGGAVKPIVIEIKLKEGAKGEKVVVEVIKEVEAILGSTKGLLLKIALVESQFGNHPDTFRQGYDGGIFQVDLIGFQDTQNVVSHPGLRVKFAKMQAAFGIDWTKVTWKDLRKPLYSAIAARLLLSNKVGAIPSSLNGQAKYWKKHYNSNAKNAKGTVQKFESRWRKYLKTKTSSSSGGGGSRPRTNTRGGRTPYRPIVKRRGRFKEYEP